MNQEAVVRCRTADGPYTKAVTFWDAEGNEVLVTRSNVIDSDVVLDMFDTIANRISIGMALGRPISNTSEESDPF